MDLLAYKTTADFILVIVIPLFTDFDGQQTSGVNSNLFWGGTKFFPSGREMKLQSKPEGLRAEVGFLGRGDKPLLHQLGGLGSAVSSPVGFGGGPPENLKFGAT